MTDALHGVRVHAHNLVARNGTTDPRDLVAELLAGMDRSERRALLELAAGHLLMEVGATVHAAPHPVSLDATGSVR